MMKCKKMKMKEGSYRISDKEIIMLTKYGQENKDIYNKKPIKCPKAHPKNFSRSTKNPSLSSFPRNLKRKPKQI